MFLGAITKALYRQTKGVADGRGPPGHADTGFMQQRANGGEVKGQRRLDIGFRTEQQQPQAVTFTALDKVIQHALHRL